MDAVATVNHMEVQQRQIVGWAKFVAVMQIIWGAVSCLGIVSAVFGIPMIIAGVKLNRAVETMPQSQDDGFENLNSFFKINGILIIIGIVGSVLTGIILAAAGIAAAGSF